MFNFDCFKMVKRFAIIFTLVGFCFMMTSDHKDRKILSQEEITFESVPVKIFPSPHMILTQFDSIEPKSDIGVSERTVNFQKIMQEFSPSPAKNDIDSQNLIRAARFGRTFGNAFAQAFLHASSSDVDPSHKKAQINSLKRLLFSTLAKSSRLFLDNKKNDANQHILTSASVKSMRATAKVEGTPDFPSVISGQSLSPVDCGRSELADFPTSKFRSQAFLERSTISKARQHHQDDILKSAQYAVVQAARVVAAERAARTWRQRLHMA